MERRSMEQDLLSLFYWRGTTQLVGCDETVQRDCRSVKNGIQQGNDSMR